MTERDSIGQALDAFRGGRHDDARALAVALWNTTQDARAATLLALIELDANRSASALDWTRKALVRDPQNARLHVQAGRLSLGLGNPHEAASALAAAVALDPRLGRAWLELGQARMQLDDRDGAFAAFLQATQFDGERSGAMQSLLDALPPRVPESGRAVGPSPTAPQTKPEPISIVTCSVDQARFDRVAASYARALAGWPHEIVRIDDARSLAEGYTRGLARSVHPIVIFSHDDVEILAPDFGLRLAQHLRACDIVGIAGAERATGPAWSHAGHPYLHGCVIGPGVTDLELQIFSARAPLIGGIRVLDGVFLALRREIALRVGWDADIFDGFHGYDVDFTLRAAKAGFKLAVATDLGILHHSRGHFGDAWRVAATKLASKHAEVNGARSENTHCYTRPVHSTVEAMRVVDMLVARFSDHHAARAAHPVLE